MKARKKTPRKKNKNTLRFNLVLHGDVAEKFKSIPNKSAYVEKILRDVETQQNKFVFREKLRQAYREAYEEDKQLAEELDGTTGDGIE